MARKSARKRRADMNSPFSLAAKLRARVFSETPASVIDRRQDFSGPLPGCSTRRDNHRLAFIGVHETRGFQQARLVFQRNREEAMLVGVDELARLDLPPKGLDLAIPTHGTNE